MNTYSHAAQEQQDNYMANYSPANYIDGPLYDSAAKDGNYMEVCQPVCGLEFFHSSLTIFFFTCL